MRLMMQYWLRESKRTKCLIRNNAWKNNPKTSNPEYLCLLNMQQLKEEHEEALNATTVNGTKETIEELDKLCQPLKEKL